MGMQLGNRDSRSSQHISCSAAAPVVLGRDAAAASAASHSTCGHVEYIVSFLPPILLLRCCEAERSVCMITRLAAVCLSVCLPACGRTEAGDGRSAAANVNSHLSSDGHCYPLQSHCKLSCALMTSSSLPQFYSNPGSGRSLTSCLPELVTRRENLCSVVRSL
ncbi:hypothetical protein MPTK1_3g22990 [Marchantia polymorpha subsp. ruderalis]